MALVGALHILHVSGIRVNIMKPPRALKRSEYNYESTYYNNFVNQVGILGDILYPVCFMTLKLYIDDPLTSCHADISLLSNMYSIYWNVLLSVTK